MTVTRGPEPAMAAGPAVVTGGENTLARSALSTWDAIAISVSVLAPGMAMLLNVPGVAIVAGGSTPLAFLLGGIGVLALAFVIIGFTRRMASAGYAYTYASRSIGKEGGFIAGWLYAFGLACFVPMTMAGVAGLAINLLGLNTNLWFPFFLIGMAVLVALSIIRIKVTTTVQLVVGAITIAVIVLVDLFVVGKGGVSGNTLEPFTFGHTVSGGFNGVFYGIILGVTSYIGFETAADFGEETSNPRRSIPIAIIAATGFAIVFYLLTTYAITVGFGVNNGAAAGADSFALKTVAGKFVGGPFPTLIEIGGMLSAFIVCLACATAAARTLFAMGREGVLPGWFSKTNRRFKTSRQRHRYCRVGRDGGGSLDRIRLPAGCLRRRNDNDLLLLRNARDTVGDPCLHHAVPRRHGVLPAYQGQLQPAAACACTADRCGGLRRRLLRIGVPAAAVPAEPDAVPHGSLARHRNRRGGHVAGAEPSCRSAHRLDPR